MNLILRFKTWHIFALITLPWFLSSMIESEFAKDLLSIIGYALNFGYFLFTYQVCEDYITVKNKSLFLLSVFLLIIFFGGLQILLDRGQTVELTGVSALLVGGMFGFALIYSLTYIASLQVKIASLQVKLVERKSHKHTAPYLFYVFSFFFLPIGVWYLYPRLKEFVINNPLHNSN